MKRISVALFAGVIVCLIASHVDAEDAGKFKEDVLYSFSGSTHGEYPYAGVIDANGILYGTTEAGGMTCEGGVYNSCGTVFALDPKTGVENVLHAFCGDCTDGQFPFAGLIEAKGALYGTTAGGGTYVNGHYDSGEGAAFAIDPKTGAERLLYIFCSRETCEDGDIPYAGLTYANGVLYGTTWQGGGYTGCGGGFTNPGCGTVFAVDPKTGAETVVYNFCARANCADGANPYAGVIAVNGMLYGTTYGGGVGSCDGGFGCGTVFALDPNTGRETLLHTFGFGTDGTLPYANLIESNGTLYGTTQAGGRAGVGTVFALDIGTGFERVLHEFDLGNDGAYPYGGVIDVNGVLYGTTSDGGSNCAKGGCGGTVFALDPKTGAEKVIYAFCRLQKCTDGSSPRASLIDVKGALYGTTLGGGAYNFGTVFRLARH